MYFSKLDLVRSGLLLLISFTGSAQASTLPCGANGFVSEGTNTYRYSAGQFHELNWQWYGNYHARILKRTSGDIVDSNGQVLRKNQVFDLVSESDHRGCDAQIEWVLDVDFIPVP